MEVCREDLSMGRRVFFETRTEVCLREILVLKSEKVVPEEWRGYKWLNGDDHVVREDIGKFWFFLVNLNPSVVVWRVIESRLKIFQIFHENSQNSHLRSMRETKFSQHF